MPTPNANETAFARIKRLMRDLGYGDIGPLPITTAEALIGNALEELKRLRSEREAPPC